MRFNIHSKGGDFSRFVRRVLNPSNLKESSVMPNAKEKKFGPVTVTAKFPNVTLTIDAEQKGSQIIFRKKIEGP